LREGKGWHIGQLVNLDEDTEDPARGNDATDWRPGRIPGQERIPLALREVHESLSPSTADLRRECLGVQDLSGRVFCQAVPVEQAALGENPRFQELTDSLVADEAGLGWVHTV
jgi:hypothetical protein